MADPANVAIGSKCETVTAASESPDKPVKLIPDKQHEFWSAQGEVSSLTLVPAIASMAAR